MIRHHLKPTVRRFSIFMLCVLTCTVGINYKVTYADTYQRNPALHEWFSYYYTHKDNRQVKAALYYFFNSQFPASELRKKSLQGFFSQIFNQNSVQAIKWFKQCNLSKTERRPLVYAIAQADELNEAISLAQHDGWDAASIKALSLTRSPLNKRLAMVTSDDIAWYWGAFKASGNRIFLDRIINTLVQTLDTNTRMADRTQQTIVQTLHYHINHDEKISQYFYQHYNKFDKDMQSDINILLSAYESDDLDCD